ncbi:GNAT family N-acetyltransferase [Aeromonas veronii]|uniref:GNAT family N-acetyltransferase n=1 Tax=Aeromonas veronii TaxID=654 RepID=UPI0038EDFD1B
MNIEIYKQNPFEDIHPELREDIMRLVAASASDLSMFTYDNSSILKDYLDEKEGIRVSILLERIKRTDLHQSYLFYAKCKDDGRFLGFAICTPFINKASLKKLEGAAVFYIAVPKDYRGRGIFKKIINHLQNEFSYLALTCVPSLVTMYEKTGFYVKGTFQSQISLVYGEEPQNTAIIGIDDEFIMQHPSVIKKYQEAVYKHGKYAVNHSASILEADFSNSNKLANDYIKTHYPNSINQ